MPDDLFADMKKLRRIFFNANQIERLSSNFLLPIEHTLQFADFKSNTRINRLFDSTSEDNNDFEKFAKTIDSNCLTPASQADLVFADFFNFKKSGEFTDFTITVSGKEFKIHKMVLAAQSSVFKKMFTDDAEEAVQSFSGIKNFSVETFEAFLDFFYTGKVDGSVKPLEMFQLAFEFDVPVAKKLCIAKCLENLDDSNAIEVFNFAHHYELIDLKKKSFNIIQRIFPEVDDTFEDKLDEINDLAALTKQLNDLKTQRDAILTKK